jgi:hypothetical protein
MTANAPQALNLCSRSIDEVTVDILRWGRLIPGFLDTSKLLPHVVWRLRLQHSMSNTIACADTFTTTNFFVFQEFHGSFLSICQLQQLAMLNLHYP